MTDKAQLKVVKGSFVSLGTNYVLHGLATIFIFREYALVDRYIELCENDESMSFMKGARYLETENWLHSFEKGHLTTV